MYDRENQIFKSEIMFKKMFKKRFKKIIFSFKFVFQRFYDRAALTQTITILIYIVSRHELP